MFYLLKKMNVTVCSRGGEQHIVEKSLGEGNGNTDNSHLGERDCDNSMTSFHMSWGVNFNFSKTGGKYPILNSHLAAIIVFITKW